MPRNRPLVVVGDTLLDTDVEGRASRLAPDAPAPVLDVSEEHSRPGGAGLAAVLAGAFCRDPVRDALPSVLRAERPGPDGFAGQDPDRPEIVLVTALGQSRSDQLVRDLLAPRVTVLELPLRGSVPVKTRLCADGRPLLRVDRGGGTVGPVTDEVRAALAGAHTVLVSDYGRGVAARLRAELAVLAGHTQVVWDPHPRGEPPVPGARLVTPNAAEARALCSDQYPDLDGDGPHGHGRRGAALAAEWRSAAVAVTLGRRGAVLARPGDEAPLYFPPLQEADGDPCGAGDCFAATAARALADGALPEEATHEAVRRSGAFVAAGGVRNPALWGGVPGGAAGHPVPAAPGRGPGGSLADARALAADVRARGGTVVATGGCFDLLHAGHVGMLQNARRTGDCLIVCLNSDVSVRRLKGEGRPITPEADRISVLAGLDCVDAVAVFDENTPERLLRELRPHVWVKGGDYGTERLPEAATLEEWGGRVLLLPYLDGRSTTALARRAADHHGAARESTDRPGVESP
ncbi:D-glycero-beta-D-manno-heptose 1-phosphate adenylyltransferase [Streptomyces albus]|uniref:D-glycero-beta-D-manno-heptose 1-phosphate adenylyltransferase n=1 Tax=Streptomyces TaxID=1883 RepID=UPI00034E2218|nr:MULTISPECIES: D-glycero-beta-D-manno-heptose 1-phosphate adenylyltransferase [Streptomyces]EPD95390.1 RfaE, domain II [Streptomyces sp. HPH0547]QID36416.1 D-glycero-beta-D-manno-heptose 1-phosphate adenylyltransferase [Streptomyces albus]